MRYAANSANGDFQLKVIAGTRAIMMALDCDPARRKGLRGFSFFRKRQGEAQGKFLRSQKVFQSVVPDPKKKVKGKRQVFRTDLHPVQSFLWGDYTAEPGTRYEFKVYPRYGSPSALDPIDPADAISVTVKTEPEQVAKGHSIWFNRGAIASQHFAEEFKNAKPTTEQLEDLGNPMTRWLSRGLLEACLRHIDETKKGEGLRACLYEFTYKPVLQAFARAIGRGVDVQISYHKTPKNDKEIKAAGLTATKAGKRILYPRTVPKIPHNKFIVRLTKTGKPTSVWTGSTNITPSGFLGQSNTGHLVASKDVAADYLRYWESFSRDPSRDQGRAASTAISPHPAELVAKDSTTVVFSPRHRSTMLQWYANRMLDATQSVMFTAAFGVNKELVLPLAKDRDFLRFVLMERQGSAQTQQRLRADKDLVIAYGGVLGEVAKITKAGRQALPIRNFGLDKWFEKEELFRKQGNVFFVHTKFLLIDPLSDDPLVCTGSANFSDNSLLQNDENMLLIRGDTRVADIYMTEFDRIFRHFYFRNVANEIELKGAKATGAFLDESDGGSKHWTASYFKAGAFKTRRREMFFGASKTSWAANAGKREPQATAAVGDTPARGRAAAKKAPAKRTVSRKVPAKPLAVCRIPVNDHMPVQLQGVDFQRNSGLRCGT